MRFVVRGFEAQHLGQLADGGIRIALLDQHRRALNARVDVGGVNGDRATEVGHRFLVVQQQLVHLAQVLGRKAERRVGLERLLEQFGGVLQVRLTLAALDRHQVHQAQR